MRNNPGKVIGFFWKGKNSNYLKINDLLGNLNEFHKFLNIYTQEVAFKKPYPNEVLLLKSFDKLVWSFSEFRKNLVKSVSHMHIPKNYVICVLYPEQKRMNNFF